MVKKSLIEDRKFVSRLIYLVLAETLHVREAILKYPKDVEDESLKATYHALIHLEADEDLRRRDLDYKDEQDDYLEFLAETLSSGSELPKNFIKSYNKYYKNTNTPHSDSMKGLLKSICKFLNV